LRALRLKKASRKDHKENIRKDRRDQQFNNLKTAGALAQAVNLQI